MFLLSLRKAEAIITEEGGMLSHAAIISRELNIPCIVGVKNATKILHNGDIIALNVRLGEILIKERSIDQAS